jgi:hypothetical protein
VFGPTSAITDIRLEAARRSQLEAAKAHFLPKQEV